MEIALDFTFELDDNALLQLRGENENLPFDRDIAVGFIKNNNISFVIKKQERFADPATGEQDGLYLSYRLTAEASEHCFFQNVQCKIDLANVGATVTDMDPANSKLGDPVKHSYTDKDEFSFKFKPLPIGAKFSGEETVEIDIYKYEVIAFGIDKPYARWEFRQPVNKEIRLDNILQLLAKTSSNTLNDQDIEITVRFKLRAEGLSGLIPFWGKKKISLNFQQGL